MEVRVSACVVVTTMSSRAPTHDICKVKDTKLQIRSGSLALKTACRCVLDGSIPRMPRESDARDVQGTCDLKSPQARSLTLQPINWLAPHY